MLYLHLMEPNDVNSKYSGSLKVESDAFRALLSYVTSS